MAKNTLYIMIGIPGSGKSTYAQWIIMNNENTKWISRDGIRFSLLAASDNYFAKENQVYKNFISQINNGLKEGYNVIADATHLNSKSRYKLFNKLHIDRTKTTVIGIYMNLPLETCLERNEGRKGGRAYVPPHEIHNMYTRLEPPTYNEPFDYIYTYNGQTINLLERR